MNDNELITVVKECVTDVHMNVPAEQITKRGRALRARRQIPALAAALTGAAGAALAVTALLPASHQPDARLAAWTVAKQANGDIDVTIRQLQNPAGLQSTLRADGVPVNVGFNGQSLKGTCQFYPMSNNVLNAVAKAPSASSIEGGALFVINPSALPAGAGLAMEVGAAETRIGAGIRVGFTQPVPVPSSLPPGTGVGVSMGQAIGGTANGRIELRKLNALSITPVYASQQCTG